MRKIVYQRPDGGISVVHPVRNTMGETLTTDAEIEQRAWDKLPVDAINPRWADEAEIPADRSFRNAWKHDLTVDTAKAQDITKDRLRREREPLFKANDTKLQNALADGDDTAKAEAVAERDRLRDVTKLADGVTDLDVLKSLKCQ